MQKFYIENGCLKLGKPIERPGFYADNIVQNYNIMHQDPTPGKYSEEKDKQVIEKLSQFNQFMDLKIKTTPDHKYCAVYSPNYLYCDFYEQLESEKYMPIIKSQDDPLYVDRAVAKYRFTLKRNSYYAQLTSHEFIVEFLHHPENKEVMILFNDTHGQLSVYNTKGNLIHKEARADKFIRNLEIINDKFMIAHCWVWSPVDCDILYNIDELLTSKDYHPLTIWYEEDDVVYEIIDDKIKFIQLDTYSYSNKFDPELRAELARPDRFEQSSNLECHKIVKEYTCTLDKAYDILCKNRHLSIFDLIEKE